jgi:hypothetical protein
MDEIQKHGSIDGNAPSPENCGLHLEKEIL